MSYIVVILCYLISVFFSYYIVKYGTLDFARRSHYDKLSHIQTDSYVIPVKSIVAIDLMFVLCNYIATRFKPEFTSDRFIYALNFEGLRETPSAGLGFVINTLHRFTSNVEVLFYFSTFFVLLITLLAFNVCKDSTPLAFLFLCSTQYIFNTFSVLKQSYSNAFAVLAIMFFLEASKNKKYYLLGVLSIFMSTVFHHTGYFLIPVCIMLCLKKSRLTIFSYSVLMVFAVLYLDRLSIVLANAVAARLPLVSVKILQYMGDESSDGLAIEGLTFLKGLPFYIVSVWGFIKRKQIRHLISNYDNYLLISVMLSFCYITTVYNGWLYRFAYFFYLPAGVFFALLVKNTSNRNNKVIMGSSVIGILFLLTFRFVVLMFVNYGGF